MARRDTNQIGRLLNPRPDLPNPPVRDKYAAIRAVLREKYGSYGFRIEAGGDIYVTGKKPPKNARVSLAGWWRVGNVNNPKFVG